MGVKELIHFLLIIFRRNKHDSERKTSQGKKTWLPFSRLLNRLLFLIRKSLTVVFALFPWSLEKEWYSENVFIDSAGQQLQLILAVIEHQIGKHQISRDTFICQAVSISDRTISHFVVRDHCAILQCFLLACLKRAARLQALTWLSSLPSKKMMHWGALKNTWNRRMQVCWN